MKKSQIKQKDLNMVQEIIDQVYEPASLTLPRAFRKMLKREAKKDAKKAK